jgi:hypothetical protein
VPLETIDGMVIFVISTAMIFALIMSLIERRMKATETEMEVGSQPSGEGK